MKLEVFEGKTREDAKQKALEALNVSETEIKTCMELIVARDVFAPNGEALVKVVEAKVVVTDTTAYDLVI